MNLPRLLLGVSAMPSVAPSVDSRLVAEQTRRIEQLEKERGHLLDRIHELEEALYLRDGLRAKFEAECG